MNLETLKMLQQKTPKPRRLLDVVWGRMPKLYLPSCIVEKTFRAIMLDTHALNVLITLLWLQRKETIRREKGWLSRNGSDSVKVKADRKTLMRITGMSKNLVSHGVHSLAIAGYIKPDRSRNEYEQFAATEHLLLNPLTGDSLMEKEGETLLYANGMRYFSLPACLFEMKRSQAVYFFANMTAQEKRLYIAIAWLAKWKSSGDFETSAQELRTLTGMPERAFKKALDGLQERLLICNSSTSSTLRNMNIVLRDPISGELLNEFPFDRDARNNRLNWRERDSKGQLKEADLRLTTGIAERLFLESMNQRGESARQEGNGEYKFRCPFHNDSNPSCNFNPTKQCFHCFAAGCGAKGSTRKLLAKLSDLSGEESIKLLAKAVGKELDFTNPDWEALAIYDYTDKYGNVRKQVLRFPNDENGNKRFLQRRYSKDGWVYNVKGMKPMLFQRMVLEFADTLAITEGERDAETVTKLGLIGKSSVIVGTTSGGANSWDAELAKEIGYGKRVVILPDDDDAGKQYADWVEESLKAEGIEYRRVSFAGTGAKDVTEYMETHSTEELVRLIGTDWIRMPDGRTLADSANECNATAVQDCEGSLDEEIVF